MNDLRTLVNMLEHRFKHIAQGHEKFHILNLLKEYYPILQRTMTLTIELKHSKEKLKTFENTCFHLELEKDPNFKYVHKCISCGKTVYK